MATPFIHLYIYACTCNSAELLHLRFTLQGGGGGGGGGLRALVEKYAARRPNCYLEGAVDIMDCIVL